MRKNKSMCVETECLWTSAAAFGLTEDSQNGICAKCSRNECCTSPEFISPGITGLAQPMDVSVMREFKGLCRNYYVNYHAVNDFAQGAPARRALITEIVVNAWKAVREKVIVRGFIKAGIVPYGPRDTEGNFVVDAPEESDDEGLRRRMTIMRRRMTITRRRTTTKINKISSILQ
ncbi:serine/threonine-protein kinase kinX [Phytophthora nicotianae]|uniref:Serine/threonine-protein kinase kinX n=1 Tax=Phytophthora nicotianae TaxID=4792 RepID=A0A0W8BXU4_PHYNI|nr:serine/threonine-protein kinase kinX [Phytophthora nicotianae]